MRTCGWSVEPERVSWDGSHQSPTPPLGTARNGGVFKRVGTVLKLSPQQKKWISCGAPHCGPSTIPIIIKLTSFGHFPSARCHSGALPTSVCCKARYLPVRLSEVAGHAAPVCEQEKGVPSQQDADSTGLPSREGGDFQGAQSRSVPLGWAPLTIPISQMEKLEVLGQRPVASKWPSQDSKLPKSQTTGIHHDVTCYSHSIL